MRVHLGLHHLLHDLDFLVRLDLVQPFHRLQSSVQLHYFPARLVIDAIDEFQIELP